MTLLYVVVFHLTLSAPREWVPIALDKPKVNGLKGPPGPLAVLGQTEAPSRGSKIAGGQKPPRYMAVASWRRDSPIGAFNVPTLLRPGEAQGRCAFPVKQHDYGGGVLIDGAVTRTEGAPLSGHVLSSGNGRFGGPPPPTPPVTLDTRGEERRRPRAANRKDSGQCTAPGRDLGASPGPSRKFRGPNSPGP
jgi:hypothetical protein